MAVNQDQTQHRRIGRRAIVVAIAALLSSGVHAGTEIAVRFYDDNKAAQGASLSAVAHAAVEKQAGLALVAKGRDGDNAYRFGFALEPSPGELRNALNQLRSTGAVVYADIVADGRMRTKQELAPRNDPVTSIIVKTRAHANAKAASVAVAKILWTEKTGVAVSRTMPLADGAHVVTLQSPLSPTGVEKLLQRLKTDNDVVYAEVDRRATTQAQPSDPMFSSQWNLNDPVGGISAPNAWDLSTGDANAPIAILDTGILPHPDLAGRVVAGYDFIADARFSNDGDGRDADPSDPGDYVTQAESTTAGGPYQGCSVTNSTWHGTMVAGTVGAAVNNGSGVSGISWQNPIVNVRVLGKCGGALSDVADGIRWAAGMSVPGVPANPRPARVINLSLAGPGACGHILQSAITDATAAGAIIVAAAGNSNDDVVNHWPANCNGVISVAATSRNGSRAFYSNNGPSIAISAPGGGIGGSIPILRNSGTTSPDPNGYVYGQQLGSSIAAPHVSGTASLLLAMNAQLTAAEIRALLESNARAFPSVATDACTTSTCGAGIVDAARTLTSLASDGPRSAPSGPQIAPPPQSGSTHAPPPGSSPAPAPSPSPNPLPSPTPQPAPQPAPLPPAPPS
ncbi:MAG TPA: S8 family peptidase [Casimicrobiaceae bacterium]|nr:S8 family peptidase [Casimicrobiaceae bacterium]